MRAGAVASELSNYLVILGDLLAIGTVLAD
jgi:hypothetical protein